MPTPAPATRECECERQRRRRVHQRLARALRFPQRAPPARVFRRHRRLRPVAPPAQPVAQAGFIAFPRDRMPAYTVPQDTDTSDIRLQQIRTVIPARGAELLMKGQGACLGCHTIRGNPSMIGQIGPNLTHIGSRTTIAAGLYPNDARHLALWIKNARKMKPGVLMPTIGLNEYDPQLRTTMKAGLTDQQIADIVAYLQALK